MRSPRSLPLAVSFAAALLCVATRADAVSSVELVYLGGATGTDACTNGTDATPGNPGLGSGNCVTARAGDALRFAIAVDVDSLGMSAYSFGLRWDADLENELDLVSARSRATLEGVPAIPFTYLYLFHSGSEQESSAIQEGHVHEYTAVPVEVTGPYLPNTSFRVGVIAFQVNGNVNRSAGPDIELGFFPEGVFGDMNLNNVTPNFGSFSIDAQTIPEPQSLVLACTGLAALALVRRRQGSR